MTICSIAGVEIKGVCACLPKNGVDNVEACTKLYGSVERAQTIVKATGINRRRIASPGVSSLDLCTQAAEALLDESKIDRAQIGAVVCVTFTPERSMPCNACQAQARLKLGHDIIAFDLGLACSGYAYGLYVSAMLAKSTGKSVLLLDGDVQSDRIRPDDEATVPVLADAGSATLIAPSAAVDEWQFAFHAQGEGGEALALPRKGEIAMDGFAVFKFVATDVCRFIKEFLTETAQPVTAFDWLVPHQANVYMIRQLAKSLGMPVEKLAISGDELGNSASATVPVTMAWKRTQGKVLLLGFGGGLSASVGRVVVPSAAVLKVIEV